LVGLEKSPIDQVANGETTSITANNNANKYTLFISNKKISHKTNVLWETEVISKMKTLLKPGDLNLLNLYLK